MSRNGGRLLLSAIPSTTLRAVWVIFVGRPERDLSWACPLLINPRTVDLGTPVVFAILSYQKSAALWRAKIAVFLPPRCRRRSCGGAIVSVNITLTQRYHDRAKTFRTRLYSSYRAGMGTGTGAGTDAGAGMVPGRPGCWSVRVSGGSGLRSGAGVGADADAGTGAGTGAV